MIDYGQLLVGLLFNPSVHLQLRHLFAVWACRRFARDQPLFLLLVRHQVTILALAVLGQRQQQ